MKNLTSAIARASAATRKHGRGHYVVFSPAEEATGDDYHVADEFDLDGFFTGCEVLFATDDLGTAAEFECA